jgi:RNA polymerase primary sigma factor
MAVDKRKRTSARIVEQTDSIKQYWKDSRKYKPLTEEEEQELFCKYSKCTSKIEKERIETILLMSNQRLIYSKALNFTKDPDLIQDYIREGGIGLLTAIKKFDKDKGVRFMTFAVDYIYREMYEYHSRYGELVRRSNDKKIGKRIKSICDAFYTKEERDPTVEELKEIFKSKYGIEIKEDVDLLPVNMSSIDDTGGQGNVDNEVDQTETGEFAVATASLNGFIEKEEIEHTNRLANALLEKLENPRDREIVKLAYGIGCDYEMDRDDIAKKFNMTRTRVNQIIASSLQKMRQF